MKEKKREKGGWGMGIGKEEREGREQGNGCDSGNGRKMKMDGEGREQLRKVRGEAKKRWM